MIDRTHILRILFEAGFPRPQFVSATLTPLLRYLFSVISSPFSLLRFLFSVFFSPFSLLCFLFSAISSPLSLLFILLFIHFFSFLFSCIQYLFLYSLLFFHLSVCLSICLSIQPAPPSITLVFCHILANGVPARYFAKVDHAVIAWRPFHGTLLWPTAHKTGVSHARVPCTA